jgi:hypothetical protein
MLPETKNAHNLGIPIIAFRNKIETMLSVRQVMASVFWDHKDVLLVDFLHGGNIVTALHQSRTFDMLTAGHSRKKPELSREGQPGL